MVEDKEDVVTDATNDHSEDTNHGPPLLSGYEKEIVGGWFKVEWITTGTGDNTAKNDPNPLIEDDNVTNSTVNNDSKNGGISYFACIAAQHIPKHTLIHTERLTLQGQDIWTAMKLYNTGEHTSQSDEDAYLAKECGLSETQRNQLWKLHDQRHESDGTDDDDIKLDPQIRTQRRRLMGIVYSNAFSNIELGSEPCLFVGATSRFNHSCRPNVGFDFAGYTIRLFTTRHVHPEEELCFCYNDVAFYHSSLVRRTFLKTNCQFDCQCVACASSTSSDVSDRRRRRLGRLAQHLSLHLEGTGIHASMLYNHVFEQKVRQVQPEKTMEMIDQDKPLSSPIDKDRQFEELMEYMELLKIESIDHDMLSSTELAYDLAIELRRNSPITNNAMTSTSKKGAESSIISDRHPDPSIKESISQTATRPRDPAIWAAKTLALFQLHKGPNHTYTKTFQLKVQSHGIEVPP